MAAAPCARPSAKGTTEAPSRGRPAGTSPYLGVALLLAGAVLVLSAPAAVEAAGAFGGGLSLSVNHAPCVRLFHSGGDAGCRTPGREGVAGPLLLVDSERVLQDIESFGSPALHGENESGRDPDTLRGGDASEGAAAAELWEDTIADGEGLLAVLPQTFFNASILERLSATGRLGGVLVLEEAGSKVLAGSDGVQDGRPAGVRPAPAGSSGDGGEGGSGGGGVGAVSNPDVKTPQGESTPSAAFDVDASYPWNSGGDGLLMESLDFPVVLVTGGGAADEVRTRAVSNGNLGGPSWRYPLHKGRMSFYFGGSEEGLNSQECLGWTDISGDRSPQCKPLGGQSSWAAVGSPGAGGRETVFAVAGMDSTSMFHDRAPGANSAVSGLVALLCAAESLGASGRSGGVDYSALPRQIVFAAFQAEAYGFIGSRRFLQDWRGEGVSCRNMADASVSPTGAEACLDPLYPTLEFQKLGRPAHVVAVDQVGCLPESTLWIHPSSGASAADQGVLSGLSPDPRLGDVVLANSTRAELPPTPLTSFVKADPGQSGFVISGYDDAYSCPHYHDHLDTRATVNASSVAAAAEVLAMSTLVLAGGTEAAAKALEVNATLVETLLGCLLEDWSCDAVREYVVGELANLEEMLGFRVSAEAPFPPTMYAGVLDFHNGGGLPTVRHTKGDGSWKLHPSWTEPFDPDHDKIQLVPSLVEMFCRAFLSEQLGSAHAGRYGQAECNSSGDCPAEECQQGWGEEASAVGASAAAAAAAVAEGGEGGDSAQSSRSGTKRSGEPSRGDSETGSAGAGGPHPECVRGRCGCPSGFSHIALGVGLEREHLINQYRVVGDAVKGGAALWTEPNWRDIGVEVYLDPGGAVGMVAVGVGAAITAAAGVASWLLLRSLEKRKLL